MIKKQSNNTIGLFIPYLIMFFSLNILIGNISFADDPLDEISGTEDWDEYGTNNKYWAEMEKEYEKWEREKTVHAIHKRDRDREIRLMKNFKNHGWQAIVPNSNNFVLEQKSNSNMQFNQLETNNTKKPVSNVNIPFNSGKTRTPVISNTKSTTHPTTLKHSFVPSSNSQLNTNKTPKNAFKPNTFKPKWGKLPDIKPVPKSNNTLQEKERSQIKTIIIGSPPQKKSEDFNIQMSPAEISISSENDSSITKSNNYPIIIRPEKTPKSFKIIEPVKVEKIKPIYIEPVKTNTKPPVIINNNTYPTQNDYTVNEDSFLEEPPKKIIPKYNKPSNQKQIFKSSTKKPRDFAPSRKLKQEDIAEKGKGYFDSSGQYVDPELNQELEEEEDSDEDE